MRLCYRTGNVSDFLFHHGQLSVIPRYVMHQVMIVMHVKAFKAVDWSSCLKLSPYSPYQIVVVCGVVDLVTSNGNRGVLQL